MNLLKLAKDLSIKAGNAALKIREGGVDSTLKSDGTLFTEGDEISHSILLTLDNFSGIPVLSEEMKEGEYLKSQKRYESQGKVWIIDPLDGTKEYKKGLNEYSISVALINKGKPTIGVVYAPARNLLLFGELNKGAFELNTKKKTESILKTSSIKEFKKMKLLVSSSELNKSAYPDYTNNLLRLGYEENDERIQSLGSTTLKTALIANGSADYNFTFTAWDYKKSKLRITKEWDIAATYLLVKEAGGVMTDCMGNDFVFGKEDPKNYNGIFTSNSKQNHFKLMNHVLERINFDKIKTKT